MFLFLLLSCARHRDIASSLKLGNFHQARNVNLASYKGGASGNLCTKATENLSPCYQYFVGRQLQKRIHLHAKCIAPCLATFVLFIAVRRRVSDCRADFIYNNHIAFCFDEESSLSIVDHKGSRVIHKFNKRRARRDLQGNLLECSSGDRNTDRTVVVNLACFTKL